jgi:preprotein translocase subunit SecE
MQHAESAVWRPVPGYLRGVWLELLKVDWPTRREVISLSAVVLATVGTVTVFVFALDAAFARAIVSVLT